MTPPVEPCRMRSMFIKTLIAGLLLAPQQAHARNVGWFLKGAGSVEVAEEVDLPLYRGDLGEHRPLVQVQRTVNGEPRSVLAVVDVGHSWTKIGHNLASELRIVPESTVIRGEWTRVAVIDELTLGGVVIRDLPVEVVLGDDLVIGFGAIPQVAVAILPSEGVVRVVPGNKGRKLVESVGDPLPLYRQTKGKWKEEGRVVWGNGMAFAVDGSISGRDGRLGLRTDSELTEVTAQYRDTEQQRRHGVVHHRGRGRIGSVELPEGWVRRNESLSDPAPNFVGDIAYDQLYGVDLAVSAASGVASVRKAETVTWTPTTEIALELARARHKAAGLDEVADKVDAPPRMGFDMDGPPANPEGDPGDPVVASLERNLARALWDSGQLDEAMPHYLRAAEAAGDRCAPHMELGLRRLAWSGTLQEQDFIVRLIRQPLREAGTLWDRWAALPTETRDAIRRGDPVPAGTFKIEQGARCLTAWGTLMAAYVAQGNTTESSAIYREHYGSDPLVSFAQAISLLHQGQPATAEIPIREALSFNVAEEGDIKLGLGRALADQGKKEAVEAVVAELPGLELNQPLTGAMMALEWGRKLNGDAGAKAMARILVKADPWWVPAQLMAVWQGLEEADVNQLGAELVRQRRRDAGSLELDIHQALFTALNGDPDKARKELKALQKARPPHPDLFAAMALVATIRNKPGQIESARRELRLRYPTVPFIDLGLPAAPTEPDEEAASGD